MRKKNFKGRCQKRSLGKCNDVIRAYDEIQVAYAEILQKCDDVKVFQCNVLMEGLSLGEYTTDFVCVKMNETLMVQDKFFEHMQETGFNGFVRGERGSTAENLSSLEYKIQQDKKRLETIEKKIANEKVNYNENHKAFMTFQEIDGSGKKSFTGKYTVSGEDYEKLTTLAKRSYSAVSDMQHLKEENRRLTHQIWSLQSEVSQLKAALQELTEKCKPYLEALEVAPQKVKTFLDDILDKFKKQEKKHSL